MPVKLNDFLNSLKINQNEINDLKNENLKLRNLKMIQEIELLKCRQKKLDPKKTENKTPVIVIISLLVVFIIAAITLIITFRWLWYNHIGGPEKPEKPLYNGNIEIINILK